jgi:TetR/AcrR family transcriptional repressor of nem operon
VARPNQTLEQAKKLLPIVCQVFSELGYRRTTTAELAERCAVRENILYRLWPDKKAMFLAAIADIFRTRAQIWHEILADAPAPADAVERLVKYESQHQGEFGFYRIVFTALMETDDDEIRTALRNIYKQFHQLVCRQVQSGRGLRKRESDLPVESAAWGLLGLATISNIMRELKLVPPRQRERMFAAVAKCLVG